MRAADPSDVSNSIAIVDDDRNVRETLCLLASRSGYQPAAVEPGPETADLLAQARPGTVLLDLSLGSTDAIAILRGLAEHRFSGRVLLMSGRDSGTIARVKAVGAKLGLTMLDPLSKPVRKAQLVAALAADHRSELVFTESGRVDVLEAIEHDWLEVWYQPKIDLSRNTICGAEGLIRMRHPQLGLIPPARFVPAPSEAAYPTMTAEVMRLVSADAKLLKTLGLPSLAINASMTMIQDSFFLGLVRDLWPAGEDRPKLVVEITEDDAIGDVSAAVMAATQLNLYDIELSIDDFGAGYSSFSRLRELPVSELKLDRSFVSGCASNPQQRSFCEATAALARRFGVRSVAEGIETEDELAVLREAGFDVGQGYLFSKPLPLDAFTEHLRAT